MTDAQPSDSRTPERAVYLWRGAKPLMGALCLVEPNWRLYSIAVTRSEAKSRKENGTEESIDRGGVIHQQGEQSVTAPPTTEGVGLKGRQALHPTDLSHPSQSQGTFHIAARRSEASNCSFSKLHLQKAGSTRPAGLF